MTIRVTCLDRQLICSIFPPAFFSLCQQSHLYCWPTCRRAWSPRGVLWKWQGEESQPSWWQTLLVLIFVCTELLIQFFSTLGVLEKSKTSSSVCVCMNSPLFFCNAFYSFWAICKMEPAVCFLWPRNTHTHTHTHSFSLSLSCNYGSLLPKANQNTHWLSQKPVFILQTEAGVCCIIHYWVFPVFSLSSRDKT